MLGSSRSGKAGGECKSTWPSRVLKILNLDSRGWVKVTIKQKICLEVLLLKLPPPGRTLPSSSPSFVLETWLSLRGTDTSTGLSSLVSWSSYDVFELYTNEDWFNDSSVHQQYCGWSSVLNIKDKCTEQRPASVSDLSIPMVAFGLSSETSKREKSAMMILTIFGI